LFLGKNSSALSKKSCTCQAKNQLTFCLEKQTKFLIFNFSFSKDKIFSKTLGGIDSLFFSQKILTILLKLFVCIK